jgi:hypothetical protein
VTLRDCQLSAGSNGSLMSVRQADVPMHRSAMVNRAVAFGGFSANDRPLGPVVRRGPQPVPSGFRANPLRLSRLARLDLDPASALQDRLMKKQTTPRPLPPASKARRRRDGVGGADNESVGQGSR